MASFTIIRAKASTDQSRTYRVILDGKTIGEVFNGQTRTYPVSAGQHQLRLKADWRGSRKFSFSVGKDDTIHFAVKPRFDAANTIANLWCMIFAWSAYLLLDRTAALPAKQAPAPAAEPAAAVAAAEPAPEPVAEAPAEAPPAAAAASPAPQSAASSALQQAIAEKKKADPLIGLKISAKELVNELIAGMKNEQGVHIESLLSALGALAGYSCQVSVREEWINSGKMTEGQAFVITETDDGRRYFFGDLLNKPLAENPYSVWSLAAGGANHAGSTALPDINAIFTQVAGSVGSASFGIPNIPEQHAASDTPVNYVKFIWPKVLPTATQFADTPADWPIVFGLAIQQVIVMAKDVIDPTMAVRIVMESAVPMSKIDMGAGED